MGAERPRQAWVAAVAEGVAPVAQGQQIPQLMGAAAVAFDYVVRHPGPLAEPGHVPGLVDAALAAPVSDPPQLAADLGGLEALGGAVPGSLAAPALSRSSLAVGRRRLPRKKTTHRRRMPAERPVEPARSPASAWWAGGTTRENRRTAKSGRMRGCFATPLGGATILQMWLTMVVGTRVGEARHR